MNNKSILKTTVTSLTGPFKQLALITGYSVGTTYSDTDVLSAKATLDAIAATGTSNPEPMEDLATKDWVTGGFIPVTETNFSQAETVGHSDGYYATKYNGQQVRLWGSQDNINYNHKILLNTNLGLRIEYYNNNVTQSGRYVELNSSGIRITNGAANYLDIAYNRINFNLASSSIDFQGNGGNYIKFTGSGSSYISFNGSDSSILFNGTQNKIQMIASNSYIQTNGAYRTLSKASDTDSKSGIFIKDSKIVITPISQVAGIAGIEFTHSTADTGWSGSTGGIFAKYFGTQQVFSVNFGEGIEMYGTGMGEVRINARLYTDEIIASDVRMTHSNWGGVYNSLMDFCNDVWERIQHL